MSKRGKKSKTGKKKAQFNRVFRYKRPEKLDKTWHLEAFIYTDFYDTQK